MAISNNPVGGTPYKFEGKPDVKVDKAAGEKLDLDGNHTIDKAEQEIAEVAAGKDAIVLDKSTNTITLKDDAAKPMEDAKKAKDELGNLCQSDYFKGPVDGEKKGELKDALTSKMEKIYGPDKAAKIADALEKDPAKMDELIKMMNALPPNTSGILKNCLVVMNPKGDGSGC